MTIHEPATLATDYLLALLGFGLAWHLAWHGAKAHPARRWWCRSIAAMAVSALAGGSYHGFAPNCSPLIDAIWWRMVLALICLMGLTMALSLIRELVPADRRHGWDRVAFVKFGLSLVAVTAYPVFVVAMLDYGLAMLGWAVSALVFRRAWCGWMLAAIVLSAVAGWVQQSGWDLSDHFNHNDVFHVIQALAIIGFHQAGRFLGRATPDRP